MSGCVADDVRWVQRAHLERRLFDEALLAAPGSDARPIRLNATATALWDLLREPRSSEELFELTRPPIGIGDWTTTSSLLLHELQAQELVTVDVLGRADGGATERIRPDLPSPPDRTSSARATNDEIWRLLATFGDPLAEDSVGVDLRSRADQIAVVDLIERGGGIGQLCWAARSGWLLLGEEAAAHAHERWAANQIHCLLVERALYRAAGALDDIEVEFRVLKGVAVAHLDYPDPSWREFGDADLLVSEADFGPAVAALRDELRFDLLHEMLPAWHSAKGTTLVSGEGKMLDVHKRILTGGPGTRSQRAMFHEPQVFHLAGRRLLAPSKAARLVHAAGHLELTGARPGTHRDLVQLGDSSPAEVVEAARSLLLSAATKNAVRTHLMHRFGRDDCAQLMRALRPSITERSIGRATTGRPLTKQLIGLILTPGFRERLAVLRGTLFPDRAYLEAASRSRVNHLRRVLPRYRTPRTR